MADEEEAAGLDGVEEFVVDSFRGALIEVDGHVAEKDDVQRVIQLVVPIHKVKSFEVDLFT